MRDAGRARQALQPRVDDTVVENWNGGEGEEMGMWMLRRGGDVEVARSFNMSSMHGPHGSATRLAILRTSD